MYTRTSQSMAKEVDNGLKIDAVQGPAVAWTYLQGCKVPQETILRVLSGPRFRRTSGQPSATECIGFADEGKAMHLWRLPQE